MRSGLRNCVWRLIVFCQEKHKATGNITCSVPECGRPHHQSRSDNAIGPEHAEAFAYHGVAGDIIIAYTGFWGNRILFARMTDCPLFEGNPSFFVCNILLMLG